MLLLIVFAAGFRAVLGISIMPPYQTGLFATTTQPNPNTNPDEQPLKLIVSITRDRMMLWSISGLEGTLTAERGTYTLNLGIVRPDFAVERGTLHAIKGRGGALTREKLVALAARRFVIGKLGLASL